MAHRFPVIWPKARCRWAEGSAIYYRRNLESETYGRTAPEIRPMGMKCEGIRSF